MARPTSKTSKKPAAKPKSYVRVAVKAGKATLQESDHPDRGFKPQRQRARKAVPGKIQTDPGIENVKRAIHEALGRDLADLLAGAKQDAVKHWTVGVDGAGCMVAASTFSSDSREPGPVPMSPMQQAVLDLSRAIDDMLEVYEEETKALIPVLAAEVPVAAVSASPPPPLPTSELAAKITRAAYAIADNTRDRRVRLGRIDL